jgi:acetate kinase
MGFSPLEGVPMATRSGSIDPGALLYLQRERGLSVDELDRALNEDSGLKGLSGLSGDIRDLEAAAAAGHSDARVAIDVYTYRIAGAVSAMAVALGGVDALAFTAGVGEHAAGVRRAVCARLGFLNVELDEDLNEGNPTDADVATATSAVRVLVIAAREELIVARAVRRLRAVTAEERS